MFSSKHPNYTKLRTNLRLCINRLKLLEKKKTELALKARKEIADYISGGKEDRARIRVEHIVREDYLVEAMEIIEMFCDLLLARFGLIEKMKELDPGLEEAIATIIWAAPRLSSDIQELKEVSNQFTIKYGKEYAEMCRKNGFENVNEKVVHKMSISAPPKILVENYMIEIARTYKVPFDADPMIMNEEPGTQVDSLIDLSLSSDGKPPLDDEFRGYNGKGGGAGGGGGGGGIPVMGHAPPFVPPGYGAPPGPAVRGPAPGQGGSAPPAEPQGGWAPPAGAVGVFPSTVTLPGYDDVINSPTVYPPPLAGSHLGPGANQSGPAFPGDPTASHQLGVPGATGQTPGPASGRLSPRLPDLPDVPGLPSVPTSTLGTASAGGEDVDFDDLSRRFEELKRKK